jgi:hypothetical protein
MKNIITIMMFFALVFSSCNEESIGLQPQDNVAPGPLTEVSYKPTPGGAIFRYKLPADEDLLYVKAVYYRKEGVLSETKASIYADTLMIEGFGNTQPREVKLIAVDRSRNESVAVTQTITPLEPDIFPIAESLYVVPDFGGIHAYWDNPNKREIAIHIMEKDNNDELIPFEIYYSSAVKGEMAIYGMDTIPRDFVVFVQDKWENQTPDNTYTLSPLFETMFVKSLFRAYNLPGDGPFGTRPVPNIWDNDLNSFVDSGVTGMPQSMTFDMGVLGRISRVRFYQRAGVYTFAEGNPKNFEIYGATELDLSGNWDSWTRLMVCESVKPSGLPLGTNSAEDMVVATQGEDFFNSIDNPPVRYIRIKILRTWAGGSNFQTCEVEFFGDNR